MTNCPCGSHKNYDDCCGQYISGQAFPATPEALMRSRYTAYSRANINYITQTMKGPAAKDFNQEDAEQWARQTTWLGLEVINAKMGENLGWVEFIAHYSYEGKKYNLHEISEFQLENGKWYYVDGETPSEKPIKNLAEKVGRNDLCPCGSNKKFKKCCGKD